MAAVAKNPAFAKKVGIKQSVGQDFLTADKGKKFGSGGMAKKLFGGKETYSEEMKEAKAVKSGKISPANFVQGEKSEGHKEEKSGKLAMAIKTGKMSPAKYATMEAKEPKGMKKGGKVCMARGGGIEVRGKTKGTMIKMKGC